MCACVLTVIYVSSLGLADGPASIGDEQGAGVVTMQTEEMVNAEEADPRTEIATYLAEMEDAYGVSLSVVEDAFDTLDVASIKQQIDEAVAVSLENERQYAVIHQMFENGEFDDVTDPAVAHELIANATSNGTTNRYAERNH